MNTVLALRDEETLELVTPDLLYQWVTRSEFSAYVGSGLGSSCYPTWHALVGEICDNCHVDTSSLDERDVNKYLEYLDKALHKDKKAFCQSVYSRFRRNTQGVTPNAYRYIFELPFRSIITTNFDDGFADLNRTLRERRKVYCFPKLPAVEVGRGGIFYLHGKPQAQDFPVTSVILGQASFAQAYRDRAILYSFLNSIWLEENLVVFGGRLEEPPLRWLLRFCNRMARDQERVEGVHPPKRFIVLPRFPEPSQFPEELPRYSSQPISELADLREMGLHALTYPASRDEGAKECHAHLYDFLSAMLDLALTRPPQTAPPWTPPT